jgi:hypothetical protein
VCGGVGGGVRGTTHRCSKGKEPHAARRTAHGKRSCCLFAVAMRMQADGTLALPQPNSIAATPRHTLLAATASLATASLLQPGCYTTMRQTQYPHNYGHMTEPSFLHPPCYSLEAHCYSLLATATQLQPDKPYSLTVQVAACGLDHDGQRPQALLQHLQGTWQPLNIPAQVQRQGTLVGGSLHTCWHTGTGTQAGGSVSMGQKGMCDSYMEGGARTLSHVQCGCQRTPVGGWGGGPQAQNQQGRSSKLIHDPHEHRR